MATLHKQDVVSALTRIGELAAERGERVELLLFGGGLMVLMFETRPQTRPSTRDLDVVVVAPPDVARVRVLAEIVAGERGWQADWLNDAVKGFVVGTSRGPVVLAAPGIEVRRPSLEQLLAMKLCAWRDDVDIADARRLLQELSGTYDLVWRGVARHLQPGRELKAKYAFDDLWEESRGRH